MLKMNRFKQYAERKKQEYEKLVSRLEKQALNGTEPTDSEVEELYRCNKNIKTAERLSENHEINQRISDSKLRFLTYDCDINRPEFDDEVYDKIRKAISQTKDLTTDERKYVIERLFDFRAQIERRTMRQDMYYALSISNPKDIIRGLLKQQSKLHQILR